MSIRSGMYVQHKYRDDKLRYMVTFIKDGKVYLDSKFDEYWFVENSIHSTRLLHKVLNYLRFRK